MEEELRTSWGKDLWEIFERGTKEEKMKTLLGSRQIIDGGKLERKNRDAAVKKFLEKIDEIRKEKICLTSEDQEDSTNQQKARSKKR